MTLIIGLIAGALAGGLVEIVLNDFLEKWLPSDRRNYKHYIAIGAAIVAFFVIGLVMESLNSKESNISTINFDDNYGEIISNPVINENITIVEPSQPIIRDSFTQDDALQRLYNDENLTFNNDGLVKTPDGTEIRKILAAPYTQNQIPRYILLTETKTPENYCHFCRPPIDGALFTLVDNDWQTTITHLGITEVGSFGRAPQQGELIKIGPDKWGFQFGWEYGNMGVVVGGIILITDRANSFRVIFEAETYVYTDCEIDLVICVSYDSIVTFVEGQNPNFYDISFTSSGTRVNDIGSIEEVDENKIYVYSSGEYVPTN